ncbi:MAG: High-affinity zinc uptake system membrane protein ZnuB [Chlamydiales bacterium]|nr:High-affinity zinc uptake system membrane protein ZnuB [Chlamydiales bacterium]MCH9635640.1 High-affinity zinc uptake system membrane protein ZnuB [Chlamydiales bacterium]
MNFLQALCQNPLLQMALIACVGASFASGIIGSFVVTKRIVSLTGSIAHSVLGGLGCALFLRRVYHLEWLMPIYGAIIGSLISALIIGYVHLHYREREDSIIAMIWSVGMASGVIFASQTPGFNVELMNFLLGNVLWVSSTDLIILGLLDLVILAVVWVKYKHFLALCFDEDQAKLQGLNVPRLYFLLLGLIALGVVLLVHTVGIILVLSMLVLPPAIAEKFTFKLSRMIGISIMLNILFSLGGLAISYKLDWPAGATISLFSAGIYVLSLRFKRAVSVSSPSPVSAEIDTASG